MDQQVVPNFSNYLAQIESAIDKAIVQMGAKTALRDACEYSLKSKGKRFRPLLVCLIADALKNPDSVMDAALCTEFFHTASLIIDDLPVMDNDSVRRGKPSLHIAYGESTALLASYALITAAFEKIHTASSQMKQNPAYSIKDVDARGMIALHEVSRCAGILGATTGQFYDLFPPLLSLESLTQVAYQKTGTLFEIAFILGWIFSAGCLELLSELKICAYHLGIAFQIGDDLADYYQDQKGSHEMSFATFLGEEKARELFLQHLEKAKTHLIQLQLYTPSMQEVLRQIHQMGTKK